MHCIVLDECAVGWRWRVLDPAGSVWAEGTAENHELARAAALECGRPSLDPAAFAGPAGAREARTVPTAVRGH